MPPTRRSTPVAPSSAVDDDNAVEKTTGGHGRRRTAHKREGTGRVTTAAQYTMRSKRGEFQLNKELRRDSMGFEDIDDFWGKKQPPPSTGGKSRVSTRLLVADEDGDVDMDPQDKENSYENQSSPVMASPPASANTEKSSTTSSESAAAEIPETPQQKNNSPASTPMRSNQILPAPKNNSPTIEDILTATPTPKKSSPAPATQETNSGISSTQEENNPPPVTREKNSPAPIEKKSSPAPATQKQSSPAPTQTKSSPAPATQKKSPAPATQKKSSPTLATQKKSGPVATPDVVTTDMEERSAHEEEHGEITEDEQLEAPDMPDAYEDNGDNDNYGNGGADGDDDMGGGTSGWDSPVNDNSPAVASNSTKKSKSSSAKRPSKSPASVRRTPAAASSGSAATTSAKRQDGAPAVVESGIKKRRLSFDEQEEQQEQTSTSSNKSALKKRSRARDDDDSDIDDDDASMLESTSKHKNKKHAEAATKKKEKKFEVEYSSDSSAEKEPPQAQKNKKKKKKITGKVRRVIPPVADPHAGVATPGMRRSTRQRWAPLEHWKGERLLTQRVVVQHDEDGNDIVNGAIEKVEAQRPELFMSPTPAKPRMRRPKQTRSANAKKKNSKGSAAEKIAKKASMMQPIKVGFVPDDPEDLVEWHDPVTSQLKSAQLVREGAGIQFQELPGERGFVAAKGAAAFDEPQLVSGVLEVPPGAKKPQERTRDYTQVFVVIDAQPGSLEVELQERRFLLSAFDHILVPANTSYAMTNHSTEASAKVAFTLVKPPQIQKNARHVDQMEDQESD